MKKFNKIFVCGISRTGTKSLGDFLKGFDLKIKSGEYVAFCGSSGSGKSTIVKLI